MYYRFLSVIFLLKKISASAADLPFCRSGQGHKVSCWAKFISSLHWKFLLISSHLSSFVHHILVVFMQSSYDPLSWVLNCTKCSSLMCKICAQDCSPFQKYSCCVLQQHHLLLLLHYFLGHTILLLYADFILKPRTWPCKVIMLQAQMLFLTWQYFWRFC